MSELKVPIVATVIGEGGSGGALAIGVADRVNMMQFSTYSVISPEGCASILWKSAERANDAATALGITSERLKDLGLIDEIITEPLGGAHRDFDGASTALRDSLVSNLDTLEALPIGELLVQRRARLRGYGQFDG